MDFSDLETEQKLAFCQQRLGYWANQMGGQVVTKTDDDEVELRTKMGERPTRVVVDYDTGWTHIQTKIANTTGILVLSWDADKQPGAPHDPEWDSSDEQVMFLAPGVYIEEYPDEAKAMWELIGRVPQALMGEIVQSMPTRFSSLKVDSDVIDLRFKANFDQLPDNAGALQWVFAMIDRIARHFEAGQESVAAKPKLYIGGQAANVATMASCPHCNTVVDLSQGSFCFNCGAPMKPNLP